jgi:Flp pilus assembly pilin Flp
MLIKWIPASLGAFILSLTIQAAPPHHCVGQLQASGGDMTRLIRRLWAEEQGQDIAEYAVMLAVILVLVVGTIRLIGGSANNVFSQTASSIGQ